MIYSSPTYRNFRAVRFYINSTIINFIIVRNYIYSTIRLFRIIEYKRHVLGLNSGEFATFRDNIESMHIQYFNSLEFEGITECNKKKKWGNDK